MGPPIHSFLAGIPLPWGPNEASRLVPADGRYEKYVFKFLFNKTKQMH